MINKQTIISAYDEKLTLLQWLKLVNKALDEAVLTNVEINQRGNATFVFVFTFEDGTKVESNEIIVNQGESVNGATIRNGHLYLSLTNGDELDAGNVKPVTSFEINASQHLVVNYGDGTSQDLGAIFSGNVNIDGNFTANSIIENMEGYSFNFTSGPATGFTITPIYAGVCKNGNKITFVWFMKLRTTTASAMSYAGDFIIPKTISGKLFAVGALDNALAVGKVEMFKSVASSETYNYSIQKYPQGDKTRITLVLRNISQLSLDTDYYFRVEATFLLNDSLAV